MGVPFLEKLVAAVRGVGGGGVATLPSIGQSDEGGGVSKARQLQALAKAGIVQSRRREVSSRVQVRSCGSSLLTRQGLREPLEGIRDEIASFRAWVLPTLRQASRSVGSIRGGGWCCG
jgi:hypothetical protein